MDLQKSTAKRARLSVRNIGGIDETAVTFSSGVTVLEGHNATNRTSLLQSIMASCGSDSVSIKGDAESATVTLSFDGEQYERTLTRQGGRVIGRGDSPVDDPELATLFAFLLESNEARQAVARREDLREIIMRPVDTGTIRREIREAENRKREIDTRLDELDALAAKLPGLREQREGVIDSIETAEAELTALEDEIADSTEGTESEQPEQAAIEEKLAELRELRAELDDVRYDAETERESLGQLEAERNDLLDERETLPETAEDAETLKRELAQSRERREQLEAKIGELDTVIQFNRQMLDDSQAGIQDELGGESDSPTGKLLDESVVSCWTCGSTVERDTIEGTRSLLEDLREQAATKRDEVVAEISQLEAQQSDIEQRQQRRTEIDHRLNRIDEEIEVRKTAIDELQQRREDVAAAIERTENAVERLREESESEVLNLHEDADDLERKLGRLSEERDSLDEEIGEVESALDERAELAVERESLTEELVERRTRIERVQNEAIEAFNDRMETVLELLGYDNLDRVWIERTETGDGEATFDLHIVRNATSGAAYEDTIDHLSESEREVVGLVFGLAGYLAHDVHKTCPFILLDSVEAIDADRIATLVEYFADYSRFLVVALLPGDAAALNDEYERVTEI